MLVFVCVIDFVVVVIELHSYDDMVAGSHCLSSAIELRRRTRKSSFNINDFISINSHNDSNTIQR